MKKQDAFAKTNINNNNENQENIITSSNFETLSHKLSKLNLSDNIDEASFNNNESPSDVDNEQKEPEEYNRKSSTDSVSISRKNSLDPSEYYSRQPKQNISSPSAYDDEYKGGKDDEIDEQSEEEKFMSSASGRYLTTKRVSLAESKNEFHKYNPYDSQFPKSSLPENKSNQHSLNNDHICPTIKSLRRDSTVSLTPFNSETEQTLSEVEAMQRKYSAVIKPSNLNVSRLNTNNENKLEQPQKKEMSNKNESKEYNIKIILNPGNSTYSIDHPQGENVKLFNLNTEINKTDVKVSFMGDSGLDLH